MISYLDRQTLSLTWKDFIAPQYGWDDADYGRITAYFSLVYAVVMPFAGKFIDWRGAKNGYLWAMAIWSFGAILHAFSTIALSGVLADTWLTSFDGAREALHDAGAAALPITTLSVYIFMACHYIMGIGQSGNFPAANRAIAFFFPKKDRAFATAVFNSGASIGALLAPLAIPLLANRYGWETSFAVIGTIGYAWMFAWAKLYKPPQIKPHLNQQEFEYIYQDETIHYDAPVPIDLGPHLTLRRLFTYPQTWAFMLGKFMTDGMWWFLLFWTPAYLSDRYGYTTDSDMGIALNFTLYVITLLAICGGYLPTYIINRYGLAPYAARQRAMFLFACLTLLAFVAQPVGALSPWALVILIGILGAAHQSWSACLYSIVGDLFPRRVIAAVTGIGGMGGGIGSFIVLILSGQLLTYAERAGVHFQLLGYQGKEAAYALIFSALATTYLIGWLIIKALAPTEKKIEVNSQRSQRS